MLENLNTVNWHQLQHAYGFADDIPKLLQELVFVENRKGRNEILRELALRIDYQGTVYEATPHAIEFIVQIIKNRTVKGRMDVVGVLANLYKGGVFYDNIVDDDTKKHQNHVNTAVVSYLPVYLGLLIADPEDEVRVAIATMISTFKDYEHSITPVILQVLNTEKTPRLRACFVRGLWELTSPDLRYVSLFISIFNSSQENESVRWASATNILESNNITRTVPVGDT